MKLFGNPPRIGLALGSGAARGLAHIGVLKVLEEAGIEIAAIAGTSIGALIGALYAAGVPVADMEEVAEAVDWKSIASLVDPILPTAGLIDGKRVSRFFSELLPVRDFNDLRLPLAMVTTDVERGEVVIINRGDLLTALRAAIAFPGIFTPVPFGDRFLVDGGLCHPVPADIVRELGADKVIGVCAIPKVEKPRREAYLPLQASTSRDQSSLLGRFSSGRVEKLWREVFSRKPADNGRNDGKNRKPPNLFRIFAQSVAIMENQINDLRLERDRIDVLIRPELSDLNLLEFHRAGEAIAAGADATRRALDQIRRLAG